MKHLLSTICLLTLFAGAAKIASAQDAGSPQEQSARSWPSPEESVATLDSKLSLTDDQKAKITSIIADRQEKMKALASESGRRRKKAREMRSIMSESDKKIEALLNGDQKKKYEEMQQERREHAKERRQQRDNGSQ